MGTPGPSGKVDLKGDWTHPILGKAFLSEDQDLNIVST